jgi:hypothetical protein
VVNLVRPNVVRLPGFCRLARTHKIIRIEKGKEILFMKICSQIRFDDFKKKRADCQRMERRLKRDSKYQITVIE